MTEKTITPEQVQAFVRAFDAGVPIEDVFSRIGITIAAPSPPEAMVQLAKQAVVKAAPVGEWGVWSDGYVAALQHVEKMVRSAQTWTLDGGKVLIERAAALKIVGAA